MVVVYMINANVTMVYKNQIFFTTTPCKKDMIFVSIIQKLSEDFKEGK